MVALQIRDVPADIRLVLADQAAARGQSLQAFLLRVITDEARRSSNLALLGRFEGRADGSRLSQTQLTDSLEQARADRESIADEVASHAG